MAVGGVPPLLVVARVQLRALDLQGRKIALRIGTEGSKADFSELLRRVALLLLQL